MAAGLLIAHHRICRALTSFWLAIQPDFMRSWSLDCNIGGGACILDICLFTPTGRPRNRTKNRTVNRTDQFIGTAGTDSGTECTKIAGLSSFADFVDDHFFVRFQDKRLQKVFVQSLRPAPTSTTTTSTIIAAISSNSPFQSRLHCF